MDIKEVKENARERMKGFCNLCRECDGVWCAGKVPGIDYGAYYSDIRSALTEHMIN